MPAAGYFYGTVPHFEGSIGNYWSGTAYSSTNAYYLNVYSGNVSPQNNYYRHNGCSVRPVRLVAVE